jgi:hypothetical protein
MEGGEVETHTWHAAGERLKYKYTSVIHASYRKTFVTDVDLREDGAVFHTEFAQDTVTFNV